MNHRYLNFVFITIVLLGIFGCGNPDEIITSTVEQRYYILNSSFEFAGEPSDDGWKFGIAPFVKFAYQAPPYGGDICVLLKALDLGGNIQRDIPLLEGKKIYSLSFWGKVNYYPGEVHVYQKKDGRLIARNSLSIEDTVWTRYAVTDTLDAADGDSLHIEVNGSNLYKVQAYTWIDLIQVEVLN